MRLPLCFVPLYPLNNTVANINLDYVGDWGGAGRSTSASSAVEIRRLIRVLARGGVVIGDTDPEDPDGPTWKARPAYMR